MTKRADNSKSIHIEPEFVEEEETFLPDEFVLGRITNWVTELKKVGVTPDKAADIASEFFFAAFTAGMNQPTDMWDMDHEDCDECDE